MKVSPQTFRSVSKYIEYKGLLDNFTALKIVKAEAGFFLEHLKYLKPFRFRARKTITQSYDELHTLEKTGIIKALKKGYAEKISPLSTFKIMSRDELTKNLEDVEKRLREENPGLLEKLREYMEGLKDKDEKTVENRIDNQLETIINSIPQIPLYVHPAISEHVHALGTVTTLEDLFENLKSWKDAGSSQKHFLVEDLDTRSRYPYMHSVLLRWFKEGDRNKILMTEPYDSDLKNGSVKFVCNLRYLEFLRGKRGELKIFTKGTKDYIIAIGKSYPRNWHPTCAELYLFDVTKYDKDTIKSYIRKLETHIVAILAEALPIPTEWQKQIFDSATNTFYPCDGPRDFEKFFEQIGFFGGETYLAYTIDLSEFVHKPMDVITVKDYLKEFLINLQNDFFQIDEILEVDVTQCTSIEKLCCAIKNYTQQLEGGHNGLFVGTSSDAVSSVPRPLRLQIALKAGVFDCEIGAYLLLAKLIKNGKKFGIHKLTLVFIPKENLLNILAKHHSQFKQTRVGELIDAYMSTISNDHLVIRAETNYGEVYILDPTNLLDDLYETFEPLKVYPELARQLEPKRVVNLSVEHGLFIDIPVPSDLNATNYEMSVESREGQGKEPGKYVIDGNPFSTYCLIAPLSKKVEVEGFINLFGFILFYSDKHIQAGLPPGSILGDTIRRLAISLIRFPKVSKAVFVKTENAKDESQLILEHLRNAFGKGQINDIIKRRGRIDEYEDEIINLIKKAKVKFEESNVNELEKKKMPIMDDIHGDFELPKRKNLSYLPKFKLLKPTIDAYMPHTDGDLYTTKSFRSVSEAYDYCVKVVKCYGKLFADSNGIHRYEVKKPYIEIALEKWDDLVEFSEKVGILEEVEGIYKNGRMFGGFGKRLEGRNLNRLEEFIVGLIRAVNSEHLNFSRDLNLEDERDTPDGVVQIGWSSVKVSLDMESTTIIMTFHHSLRSVDVHNGLPYNLYYCVKISEYILNKVREESGKDVKAGVIFISLGNLHAYYDNIARVTNLTKTKPARLPLNDTLKTE